MKKRELNRVSWQLSVKPRAWQKKAFAKWQEELRGIVGVVTGGGKTLFAFMCMTEFRKRYPAKKIIIVVPTLTLIDQWYIGLLDDLNVPISDIACFSGYAKAKGLQAVNLFSLNTARSVLPDTSDKSDYLLIIDECHRTGSEINSRAIKGDYAATLGLSATPERQYDDGFLRHIVPNLGGIIYEYDYRAALKDGVISPFELSNIQIDFLDHEQRAYNKVNQQLGAALKKYGEDKVSQSRIKSLLMKRAKISSAALMRIPLAVKITSLHSNERVLIFHENIAAANEIFELLQKRGYGVAIYHSGISPVIRRDNLRLYRLGVYNVLVTCKALDEGMNVPETTVAIIASSSASTRQRIQRLGRVLRPSKGKSKATVYTIYVSEPERQRLIREYDVFNDTVAITWLKSNANG